MALPPITNAPLFKVLDGSNKTGREQQPQQTEKPAPQDQVTLSDEALQKLETLKSADLKTAESARQTASDVRTTLEENPELTLGSGDEALV